MHGLASDRFGALLDGERGTCTLLSRHALLSFGCTWHTNNTFVVHLPQISGVEKGSRTAKAHTAAATANGSPTPAPFPDARTLVKSPCQSRQRESSADRPTLQHGSQDSLVLQALNLISFARHQMAYSQAHGGVRFPHRNSNAGRAALCPFLCTCMRRNLRFLQRKPVSRSGDLYS